MTLAIARVLVILELKFCILISPGPSNLLTKDAKRKYYFKYLNIGKLNGKYEENVKNARNRNLCYDLCGPT